MENEEGKSKASTGANLSLKGLFRHPKMQSKID